MLAVVSLATVAGCAEGPRQPPVPVACTKDALPTIYRGILTVGTDQPAYPPWYLGDDPANGDGFESAFTYAVAESLGYTRDEVRWVRVPFNAAMAPGSKSFDIDVSQFSITDQRRELVDFSSPYFDVEQAVVTVASSPAARVHTLEGLKSLRLGAQVGTTSSTAARAVGGARPVAVYNTNVDAKIALSNGEIDALVLDLPTATTVRDELDDGVIIGRLPRLGDTAEQFGVVLDKDSRLTGCVSAVVEELRRQGTLTVLEERWLGGDRVPPRLG